MSLDDACIQAIILDVDGTLTDGTFSPLADAFGGRRFSFKDIMGLCRWQRRGVRFALVSGEQHDGLAWLAAKVGIAAEDVFGGVLKKEEAVDRFIERHGLESDHVCFIGDDINDLAAMRRLGYSAAPADAVPAVLGAVKIRSRLNGGHGAGTTSS
jgi:3-deoxy-D-manno-octulosonate 8-phosphate phosphatase (KDO 8-P phosphatase)